MDCPHCNRTDLKSNAALKSHIRAKHPNINPETGKAAVEGRTLTVELPELQPGRHAINCPFCQSPTQIFINNEGNIASSEDMEELKPKSSSGRGKMFWRRSGAHPVVIDERFRQRRRPDGTWKNTVAMMGTHGRTAPKMPWREPGIKERWLLNDSHDIEYVKQHVEAGRVDRWWQMHHRWRITRRLTRHSGDHWTWLQNDTNVPRKFMQRKYADIPGSEGFKLREISEMFIGDRLGRGAGYVQVYYTNTFSYMLAQVAYEKKMGIIDWERVEIYGCELEQLETEYFRQRPGMEFWLGILVNMGIEIYFPHDTFIAYAQDIVQTQYGPRMVQYPGYMAYGYKSPSKEEAIAQKLPLGVDPVEENVMGVWEDYHKWYIHGINEGVAQMSKRHFLGDFPKEAVALTEWMEKFEDAGAQL